MVRKVASKDPSLRPAARWQYLAWLPVNLFGLMGMVLASAQASAQETASDYYAANFGNEIIAVSIPVGFSKAFEDWQLEQSIAEFLPGQQTLESWSEMVTVTTATSAQMTPEGFLAGIAAGLEQACLGPSSAELMMDSRVDGHEVLVAYVSCAQSPGTRVAASESFVAIAIAGTGSIATLQWAVRAQATGAPRPYDEGFWQARLQQLRFSFQPL